MAPLGRKNAVQVTTPNYDYYYLCTELRRKRMIPVLTNIRARTAEEFGDLVRHTGEEYIYVLEGRIEVHTEFYDPVVLEKGESIYIDSTMGHAYVTGEGCDEAVVLGVCSSDDENLALLIDELDLITYPIIIGQGTRLFSDSGPDIALDLLTSRTTSRGITIQTYRLAGRPKYAK